MNRDQILSLLARVPIGFIAVLCLGWYSWDFYQFKNDAGSPLIMKQSELKAARDENDRLRTKVAQANEFFKNLEKKKKEILAYAKELDGMKTTLSESVDVPNFMKMVVTEAKKIGLNVTSLQPQGEKKMEYYAEQIFQMDFRGYYVQLLVFLERMAQAQKIVYVDSIHTVPKGNNQEAKFVEVTGGMRVKTFYYLGSKADEIVRGGSAGDANANGANKGGGT